jgi:hypothetical protein
MEPAIKPKIGKNVLGCAGILLLVLLLLILLVAFAIAKTGIVNVPVLAQWYRGPQPTRVVSAEPKTLDEFRTDLAGKFLDEARKGKKPPYTISVSESELTGALMGGIEEGVRDEGWRESSAQSVIHSDRIEILLKLKKEDRTAEFLIDFVPQIENGGVRLVPISFQFGDYPIPVSVAERIAGSYFKRDFGITTLSVGEARLSAITLKEGVMEITASPAVSTP